MSCQEMRELYSARIDDALGAGERARLDAHLATCAECRREWQRFAATVGLLRAVEPVRAPAGFVDRVLAATRPAPWYRRLARGLLVPWTVKLPVEAAALLLIGGLAVLLFQRSPELQHAAVKSDAPVAAPESRPPVSASKAPVDATARAPKDTLEARAETATGQAASGTVEPPAPLPGAKEAEAMRRDVVRDERKGENLVSQPPPAQESQGFVPPARSGADQAEARRNQGEKMLEEPMVAGKRQRELGASSPAAPPVPPAAAPPAGAPPPAMGQSSMKARDFAAAKAAPEEQKSGRLAAVRSQALAVKKAPDVTGRLTVSDRDAAEREIAALVERIGATVIQYHDNVLELTVPRDGFAELTRGLAQLGDLRTERPATTEGPGVGLLGGYRPTELPPTVHVVLHIRG